MYEMLITRKIKKRIPKNKLQFKINKISVGIKCDFFLHKYSIDGTKTTFYIVIFSGWSLKVTIYHFEADTTSQHTI